MTDLQTRQIADAYAQVAYTTERRHKLAVAANACRSAHRRDSQLWVGLNPRAVQALKDHFRTEAHRAIAQAPARLASRRDMVRRARTLRAWANHVDQVTDWNSLWCGEQDGLCDRLDAARQEAAELRTYARYLKGRLN